MKDHSTQNQNGSALFIILIAVALFGALTYAVSGMLRSESGTNISDEKANLYANEIVDYSRNIREAIQNLRISNGCSDTDISFENPIETGYTNGSNTDCQVFNSNGGGLNWISPSPDLNDGSEWVIAGTNNVDGIGTTAPDLTLILPNISENICNAINDDLGITSTGTDAAIDFTKFQGSYASIQTIDFADGKLNGCLNFVNAGNNYFYYQVLIPR